MQIKSYYWAITLVALILGFMLAVQFRVNVQLENDPTLERTEKLTAQIEEKKKAVEELQNKVDSMRLKLEEAADEPEMKALQKELTFAGILAGVTPVSGPGLEIALNDSNAALQPGQNPNLFVLHDEDVLKILNELKAAGAEALAINDQRLIATSEIRCIGPTILVNGNKRISAPFIITAIGDPDTLYNSLYMKNGVVDSLKIWGIQVSAKKVNEIVIPSYNGAITYSQLNGGEKA